MGGRRGRDEDGRMKDRQGEERERERDARSNTLNHLFRHFPEGGVSHVLLRSSGEIELEGEAKHTVDRLQEVQTARYLIFDLSNKTLAVIMHRCAVSSLLALMHETCLAHHPRFIYTWVSHT